MKHYCQAQSQLNFSWTDWLYSQLTPDKRWHPPDKQWRLPDKQWHLPDKRWHLRKSKIGKPENFQFMNAPLLNSMTIFKSLKKFQRLFIA